jgi:RHS repeat-associated protein
VTTPIRVNQNGRKTILLATSQNQSVWAEVNQGDVNPMAYTAYGHLSAPRPASTHLGFNGELRDSHTHWYLLGNGYRAYNPALMRFHNPDKLSPFGAGGLNAYMYCVGDPINHRDPTGRIAIAVFVTQFSGVVGGTSSVLGIVLSLLKGARFSRQGIQTIVTGATGVLLGAAAIAYPASAIAPILASGSLVTGLLTVARGGASSATTRITQRLRPLAGALDSPPPRYSTLSQPPSFASLDPPPPYSSPIIQDIIAPTHTAARAASDHEALLNPTVRVTAQMGELPQLQSINEIESTAKQIRAARH